jgi:hypothetical protein
MTEQEVKDFVLNLTYDDIQDENGIDLTQIDGRLSASATDRARQLESFVALMNRQKQGKEMVDPDLKLREILEQLQSEGVEFVIVGGVAAWLNGSELPTRDLDVCCPMSVENMAKFSNAIRAMNARLRDPRNILPPFEASTLVKLNMLLLRTRLGDFDLVPEVVAVGKYDEVLKNSVERIVEGQHVRVLNLDALISAKKALMRPKDKLALMHLEAARRKQEIERQQPGLFD